MNNPVMPKPHQILDIIRETNLEYTFRIETDMRPQHGQFFQLSLPRVGECPISVSNFGEGWMEFTIRSVGKVTDQLFSLQPGDELFVRGPYGKGWPTDELRGKHLVVVAGRHGRFAGAQPAQQMRRRAGLREERRPHLRLQK